MKRMHGFTVVEVLVVIVIISMIAGITINAFNDVVRDGRDESRAGTATVVTEALEQYYSDNGEYPSVASIARTAAVSRAAAATKLSVSEKDLTLPRLTSGTNPIDGNGTAPSTTNLVYTGSPNSSICTTTVDGGCTSFTLRYVEESGTAITITSRH